MSFHKSTEFTFTVGDIQTVLQLKHSSPSAVRLPRQFTAILESFFGLTGEFGRLQIRLSLLLTDARARARAHVTGLLAPSSECVVYLAHR